MLWTGQLPTHYWTGGKASAHHWSDQGLAMDEKACQSQASGTPSIKKKWKKGEMFCVLGDKYCWVKYHGDTFVVKKKKNASVCFFFHLFFHPFLCPELWTLPLTAVLRIIIFFFLTKSCVFNESFQECQEWSKVLQDFV